MVLVALHTTLPLADGDACEILRERAAAAGFEQVETVGFEGALDFVDLADAKSETPVDLVVTPYNLPGLSSIQAIEEARAKQPNLHAIIFDEAPYHAAEAARAGVDGYLTAPASTSAFAHVLDRVLGSLRSLFDSSMLFDTRDGSVRIALDDIVYCETSGHNQLVHLRDRRTLAGRYSSQALFDQLGDDRLFFKVGSSYIVNLNEVSRLHTPSGDLALADGTGIPVPQRLRKNLEKALLDQ